VEGVFRNSYKDSKVKRKIDRISDHVVICGYGRNGSQAAQELIEHNEKIVVIEKDEHLVDSLRETPGMLYVEGDAADEEVLKQANLEVAKAMITTLPVDADNLFVVLTAKEINPQMTIISRASADNSDVKLKRAGATNVIMPDKIGGKRMAKLVAQPDVVEFIDLLLLQSMDSVVLEEVSCTKLADCFDGKSIAELDGKNTSGANVIGLKRADNSYIINPLQDTTLTSSDKLFTLGTKEQIRRFIKIISNPEVPG
jgi:voltage-gated potassium channel